MSENQVRLSITAAAHVAHLRAGGIPGIPFGDKITLTSDDGKWSLTVPTVSEFGQLRLEPGDIVVALIGITRPALAQVVPDELDLTSGRLIRPPGVN